MSEKHTLKPRTGKFGASVYSVQDHLCRLAYSVHAHCAGQAWLDIGLSDLAF